MYVSLGSIFYLWCVDLFICALLVVAYGQPIRDIIIYICIMMCTFWCN